MSNVTLGSLVFKAQTALRRSYSGDPATFSTIISRILDDTTPDRADVLALLALRHSDLFTTKPRSLSAARRAQAKAGNRPALDTALGLVQLNVREHLLFHLSQYAQETWGWDPHTYTDERGTTYRHEAKEY